MLKHFRFVASEVSVHRTESDSVPAVRLTTKPETEARETGPDQEPFQSVTPVEP